MTQIAAARLNAIVVSRHDGPAAVFAVGHPASGSVTGQIAGTAPRLNAEPARHATPPNAGAAGRRAAPVVPAPPERARIVVGVQHALTGRCGTEGTGVAVSVRHVLTGRYGTRATRAEPTGHDVLSDHCATRTTRAEPIVHNVTSGPHATKPTGGIARADLTVQVDQPVIAVIDRVGTSHGARTRAG